MQIFCKPTSFFFLKLNNGFGQFFLVLTLLPLTFFLFMKFYLLSPEYDNDANKNEQNKKRNGYDLISLKLQLLFVDKKFFFFSFIFCLHFRDRIGCSNLIYTVFCNGPKVIISACIFIVIHA